MGLPSSGTISASMINTESATVSTTNAPLSGSSSTPQTGSLVLRYDDATPTPVDQNAPHAYSEFYGKSFTPPFIPCGGELEDGSGNGYFEATVTSGSPTGAIVVYFYPQSVPDGIAYEFNSATYNDLTSNTYGYEAGTGNNLNIVGRNNITGCTEANLIANSPYTLNTSVWNGSSFGLNGGTTTVVTTNVNLNPAGGITYTLVIPKPSSTPSTGTLKIVGPCTGTGWDVKVLCPATLPSFTTNGVNSTFQGSCCAAQDRTYYFARNATVSGTNPFLVDTNTLPQVGNFVFSDSNGAGVLPNGFYRITSNTAIRTTNGVVDSIHTGCSSCLTSFTSSSGTVFSGVCATILSETYYHDGSGATPVAGDAVYSDSAGNNPLAAFYYKIGVKPVIRITGTSGVVDSGWPQAIC
tara:strand:+ start:925 stop:2151 length:1227 start_codon:yes stop_codon:yes gene_type:complete